MQQHDQDKDKQILELQHEIKTLKNDVFQLKSIIKHMPGNVFWKNRDGIYIGCNQNIANIVKLSSCEDIYGKTIFDFFDNESAKKVTEIDNSLMTNNQELLIEEEGVDEHGNYALYLTKKVPIYNLNNQVEGLLGIALNITERKQLEEYIQKFEMSQKLVNFSNLIAGSIAHELKNPLAGIKMQMEALQTIKVENIKSQNLISIIQDVTNAVIKTINSTTYVINDMLKKIRTFATGEVHHKDFETLSITADIEDMLATYPFKNNELDLIKTIFNARFKYQGDKVLTSHVLGNLMKNALYAIHESDKKDIKIVIETTIDDDFNLIIFRDNAIGINKDLQDKIFNQFETKKNVHGGTGLGLAFCKSVMKDAYGGDITCNSEEGKYTEFVLKFPKITV